MNKTTYKVYTKGNNTFDAIRCGIDSYHLPKTNVTAIMVTAHSKLNAEIKVKQLTNLDSVGVVTN